MSGPQLVIAAAALAIQLSEGLCTDDIDTLAAFFQVLGDNLALIAGQQPP